MKVFFVSVLLIYASIQSFVYGAPKAEVGVKKLEEVYAWNQITYNINGNPLTANRFGAPIQQSDDDVFIFPDDDPAPPPPSDNNEETDNANKQFFNQYNNVPMGVDKWKNKLFVTVPRRRPGIPSTLNYLDLNEDKEKSPGLRPYPNLKANSLDSETPLVNVYRTRVDACDRLWMVDTGIDEGPGEFRTIQPPAIVIYDLNTNERIGRYELKPNEDYINNDASGFASITVDVSKTDCGNAYAYLTDLSNYGMVVYSLKENTSWRVSHNFFYLDPEDGDFNVAGLNFQWSDGIFSIALGPVQKDGYRTAYFHAMASFKERAVNTRILRNQTLANTNYHDYKALGDKGPSTQTTIHGVHQSTGVMFSAQVGRSALACWNTNKPFKRENFDIIAQDSSKFIYPSDLKIDNEDNVWVISNSMPVFLYSTLNTDIMNFRIYKTSVKNAISRTVCA